MHQGRVQREFPYRHGWETVIVFIIAFTFTLAAFWLAIVNDGSVSVRGRKVEGRGASLFLWLGVVFFGTVAVMSGRFIWIRIQHPNQRIAFTAHGILLPRNRWSPKEEFVAYKDITDYNFEEYVGVGYREVTYLHIYCSAGKFSISRGKLSKETFDEICRLVVKRIEKVHPA